MLLFSRQIGSNARFGVWVIEEPDTYFTDRLSLSEEECEDLARYQAQRRLEWLAGRWLLHLLTGDQDRMPLSKTAFSKPFFLHHPERYCSLSHSKGIVAALQADGECGCDIQVMVKKMKLIAPKFMRDDEFEWIDRFPESEALPLQHLYWTAKEALYKAYGLKELDFKANMRLGPFEWHENRMQTEGFVEKEDVCQRYQLYSERYIDPETGVDFVWSVVM